MCHNGGNKQNRRGTKCAYFVQFVINSVGIYSRVPQIPAAMLPTRLYCILLAPYVMVPQYGTYCMSVFCGIEIYVAPGLWKFVYTVHFVRRGHASESEPGNCGPTDDTNARTVRKNWFGHPWYKKFDNAVLHFGAG